MKGLTKFFKFMMNSFTFPFVSVGTWTSKERGLTQLFSMILWLIGTNLIFGPWVQTVLIDKLGLGYGAGTLVFFVALAVYSFILYKLDRWLNIKIIRRSNKAK